jgi:diadenosine tetraphosphate (Ap4A) HIT family hydrolase
VNEFTFDPQLAKDCHILGEMACCLVLLMDNSLAPWFILVPRRNEIEMCDLPHDDRLSVLEEITLLSRFVRSHFKVDKLNVAAIGNVVRQLHIHVVGRKRDDFCWPGVVWGRKERQPYDYQTVEELASALAAALPSRFSRRSAQGLP